MFVTMRKSSKRLITGAMVIGTVVLFLGLLYLGLILLWKVSTHDERYQLDVFTDDDYTLITEAFELPQAVEAELIEVTFQEYWRDPSLTLIFSVRNEDSMEEYLRLNFPDLASEWHNPHDNLEMGELTYYRTASAWHTSYMGYIKQYITEDGHVLYEYHCYPGKMTNPTDVMNTIKEKGYSVPI